MNSAKKDMIRVDIVFFLTRIARLITYIHLNKCRKKIAEASSEEIYV